MALYRLISAYHQGVVIFSLSVLTLCLVQQGVQARVGENRRELEDRLLREERVGIEVSARELQSFYKGRAPLQDWFSPIRDKGEYVLYYKLTTTVIPTTGGLWESTRGDRRPVRNPDGWLFHVIYLEDQSVLEYYEKSDGLTPVEVDGILRLHATSAEWERGSPGGAGFDPPKTLPANAYLSDGSLYARISGNTLLIYFPEVDAMITERIYQKQTEEAPASLRGF